MTPGKFHRPKPATVVNAFARSIDGGPSIFCSKVNPQSGAAGFTVPAQTKVQRETKQQIVFSKARAR